MKKLLLLCLLLSPFISHASHEFGGQISAKDLGNSMYEVKIVLWLDSNSISPISWIPYQIQHGGASILDTAYQTSNFSIGNAIQELTYTDTVSMNTAGTYKLIYSLCCRNAAISNLIDPSLQDFYISTTMNVDPAVSNSTPEFLNSPILFSGVNDTFIHNPLGVDPDGDSLVFSWINPLGAGGIQIPMTIIPYPSGAGMNFTVDASTGEISWISTMTGAYIYGVQANEYRNGTLLSTTMRDVYVTICVGCKTTMSSDFQFYNKNTWSQFGSYYQFDAYENTAFSFTFSGGVSSINTNQLNMQMLGEANAFANAPVFNPTQSGTTILGTYTWTPTTAQIRNRPYLNVLIGQEKTTDNQIRKKENTILMKVNAKPSNVINVDASSEIKIFPNPARSNVFVEIDNRMNEFSTLEIYNTIGQVIYHADVIQNNGIEVQQINTASFGAGNYIIKLNGSRSAYKRISVIH